MTALLWFRRDLRVHDHPALHAALDDQDHLVPVFCFDQHLLAGRHASGPRTQFMLESLADLEASLRDRGSRLVVRTGLPERELPSLARLLGVRSVHFTGDVSPYARKRDQRVTSALTDAGVAVHEHPGMFAVDDLDAIKTSVNEPYTVFTPFYRAWMRLRRREPLSAPRTLPTIPSQLDSGVLPALSDLGLQQEVQDPIPGGESAGREAMSRFFSARVSDYDDDRDMPGKPGASRLSPYLHFGCISARELEQRLPRGAGADAFRRQLCWRDFYAQVLFHFPANARYEHQQRYRGTIRWSHAERRFDAWRKGRTGFPLVDAGMRQLRREGWMHNRVRLVVGSFLTKDLGIDWRWGERWFMRLLLDGDEASNNGNWQWIASVGVDPQPPYRRIYNPARQQQRLDPGGTYVRNYVPELGPVPDDYLAEPWTMPESVQASVGCVIGRDYPEPIVDHLDARRDALARYTAAR